MISATWWLLLVGRVGCMSSRIPRHVRQAIIEFPDKPRRGEITRFCAEHHISIAGFYKIRGQARRDGPEAAVVARSTSPTRQAGRTVSAC